MSTVPSAADARRHRGAPVASSSGASRAGAPAESLGVSSDLSLRSSARASGARGWSTGPATSHAPIRPSDPSAMRTGVDAWPSGTAADVTPAPAVATAPRTPTRRARAAPRILPMLLSSSKLSGHPLRQRPRLVTEEDLDLVGVDDAGHDAVTELLVPQQISLPEVRRHAVGLEVVHPVADDRLFPLLLVARLATRGPRGPRRRRGGRGGSRRGAHGGLVARRVRAPEVSGPTRQALHLVGLGVLHRDDAVV